MRMVRMRNAIAFAILLAVATACGSGSETVPGDGSVEVNFFPSAGDTFTDVQDVEFTLFDGVGTQVDPVTVAEGGTGQASHTFGSLALGDYTVEAQALDSTGTPIGQLASSGTISLTSGNPSQSVDLFLIGDQIADDSEQGPLIAAFSTPVSLEEQTSGEVSVNVLHELTTANIDGSSIVWSDSCTDGSNGTFSGQGFDGQAAPDYAYIVTWTTPDVANQETCTITATVTDDAANSTARGKDVDVDPVGSIQANAFLVDPSITQTEVAWDFGNQTCVATTADDTQTCGAIPGSENLDGGNQAVTITTTLDGNTDLDNDGRDDLDYRFTVGCWDAAGNFSADASPTDPPIGENSFQGPAVSSDNFVACEIVTEVDIVDPADDSVLSANHDTFSMTFQLAQ